MVWGNVILIELSNIDSLIKCLEPEKLRLNEPMSAHTALGVGGLADLFYTTENSGDLVKAVRLCRTFKIDVTVIGEGSGVVVSDSGIRGLVVRNKSERVQIKPQRSLVNFFRKRQVKKVEVVIDSGVEVRTAVDKLNSLGIVGLEKYSSHFGSVGAMVCNGEGKDFLKKMSILDTHGGVRSIGANKEIGENILTDVTYILSYGEVKKPIKKGGIKKRKSLVGVFENISEDEQKTLGYSTGDAGYIIGEILNMKGFGVGKMAIADDNQNEIVNLGGGKAEEFIALVEEIKSRAREAIGIELVEKFVRLGSF